MGGFSNEPSASRICSHDVKYKGGALLVEGMETRGPVTPSGKKLFYLTTFHIPKIKRTKYEKQNSRGGWVWLLLIPTLKTNPSCETGVN